MDFEWMNAIGAKREVTDEAACKRYYATNFDRSTRVLRTAVHESGHAVLGLTYGMVPRHMLVNSHAATGLTEFLASPTGRGLDADVVYVMLAGHAAEELFAGHPLPFAHTGSFMDVWNALFSYGAPPSLFGGILSDCSVILRERWHAVEAFAERILDAPVTDGITHRLDGPVMMQLWTEVR